MPMDRETTHLRSFSSGALKIFLLELKLELELELAAKSVI